MEADDCDKECFYKPTDFIHQREIVDFLANKGNNKITELRTILQRESQNSLVYKQTKSVNNLKTVKTVMTPELVQAFLKKWWVESDFKAPNLPLSLRLKGSGYHYNSIYNNTGRK